MQFRPQRSDSEGQATSVNEVDVAVLDVLDVVELADKIACRKSTDARDIQRNGMRHIWSCDA